MKKSNDLAGNSVWFSKSEQHIRGQISEEYPKSKVTTAWLSQTIGSCFVNREIFQDYGVAKKIYQRVQLQSQLNSSK